MPASEVDQVRVLFVAFAGWTAATRVIELFTPTEAVDVTVTPLTAMLAAVTVDEAVFWLSLVVTVIVAVPGDTPLTNPVPSTLTTDVFEELQTTF